MFFRKRTAFFGTMALTLVAGFMLGQIGQADTPSTPGSADDPIVTKSYVDGKIAQLSGGNSGNPGSAGGASTGGYKVLVLKQGQTLKASTEAGLEVIVRNGDVAAIQGQLGGLSDVTGGSDLTGGTKVTANHLLVFARNDGRGIQINSGGDTYVLVRGAYTVQ